MHIEPTKPATEQWLYEQCLEDPRAAADEIASLMWNHAKALDEIVLLRAEVARLMQPKSHGATLLDAPSEAPLIDGEKASSSRTKHEHL